MARRQTPATRAKDADRTEVCHILDSALADGQLSMTEHGRWIAEATSAATLGELDSLVADLQLPDTPSARHRRVGLPGWLIAAAVAAVVLVVGGVIAWGAQDRREAPPAGQAPTTQQASPSSAATTSPTPTGPRLLHSLDGINGLLARIREKFGDTTGYELSVYTDYAELIRPDRDDDRFTARYRYFSGTWEGPGKTPNSGDDTVVDLAAFDAAAVLAVMRGAPQTMDVEPTNVLKVWFTVGPAHDPTAPQALTVRITVSTSFGTGLIDLDGAGTVKRVKQPF